MEVKKITFRTKIELFGLAMVLYMITVGLVFWIWLSLDPINHKYSIWIWTIRIASLIILIVGFVYLLIGINHLRNLKETEQKFSKSLAN